MSGRTIKRGGKGVRRAAAAQGKALKVRSAKAKTGSLFDTVMSWLPFSEAQLHRIFLAMILGIVAVGAWMAASFAGIPALARDQVAVFAHDAGFELHNVNVRGTNNLNELKIYQIALADRLVEVAQQFLAGDAGGRPGAWGRWPCGRPDPPSCAACPCWSGPCGSSWGGWPLARGPGSSAGCARCHLGSSRSAPWGCTRSRPYRTWPCTCPPQSCR